MSVYKKAIITGASRGIGKAIAKKLAEKGYNLILVCRNNIALLEKLAVELSSQYEVMIECFKGDIGSYDFCSEVAKKGQNLTLLVNNAGVANYNLIGDISIEDFQNIISTNINGAYFMTKAVLPALLETKGKVINISSIWGEMGACGEVAYSASKGAINAMTKAMAKELGQSGITVNALQLGMINTEMNNSLDEDEIKEFVQSIPLKRMGTSDEVAELLYQIIEAPNYLNGAIINFDGGGILT